MALFQGSGGSVDTQGTFGLAVSGDSFGCPENDRAEVWVEGHCYWHPVGETLGCAKRPAVSGAGPTSVAPMIRC